MNSYEISFTDILARGTYGFVTFGVIILVILLVILWVILPFAVFRIKSLLYDNNVLLIRMNKNLTHIEELLRKQADSNVHVSPAAPVREHAFSMENAPRIRLKGEIVDEESSE